MYRKLGMYLLAALLVLLPVSGAFGGKAQAASSSRIAVIKQLSGDVQVQKSGGSKLFKAFAKLSLNQGDKLITGSKGSAVLQFANGTSEDDKFTVGENATLTFSKLSDKKGTVTKVSMLKGTAWVDVKSIKSADDDFKLETPTAIMGVRGTAFFASVNPTTGGTNTAVMSGVVRFTSENVEKTGSGGEASGGKGATERNTVDLYPTQQISLQPSSGSDPGELTTLVDIREIVKNAPPEVIEALLRSKEKIDEENRQTVEKFKQTGVPPELQQQLEQFIQNTQELLGVIAKQAIEQKKIEESQIKKIEAQEKTSFGLDKDQLSQLNEKEKEKQKKAKQLEEAAAKKKADEEAAKLKELADKINAAMLKTIEAAKQAQEEANRKALEEARRKAEQELLKKLNDQQKQQYETDKSNNNGSAPVSTPAPDTNVSSNANLGSLSLSGTTISPAFDAGVTSYTASVESSRTSIVVGASVQSGAASLTINGQAPSGGQQIVNLAYGDNEITLVVTAPGGSNRVYKVTVTRQLLNNVSVVFPGESGIDIDFNSTTAPAPLSIPSGSSNLTLVVPVTGPELDIAVNGQNVEPEPMFMAARTVLPNQISWRYIIPLTEVTNKIVIQATLDGIIKSYTLFANRTMSNETAVKNLTATGADGATTYEVVSAGNGSWTVKVPSETAAVRLKIDTINETAKVLLGGNEYASGAEIPYTIINTSVPFRVRAADGQTVKDYSITIQRMASSNASLSGLSLSAISLTPEFDSGKTSYAASVGNAVARVTVTATAANSAATITVNGATVQSGSASGAIALSAGSNQITVEVTAQDGTKQKYTVTVTRENAALAAPTFNPPSGAVAFGTQLTISSEGAEHIYYTTDGSHPAHSVTGTTKEYSASSKPTIDAAVTFKAVATRAGYPDSPVGSASYTQAASADLTDLALSGSPTGYGFASGIYNYSGVQVDNGIGSVTVTPTGSGTISVNGTPVVSGKSSDPILLTEGVERTITVVVATPGMVSKTYTIRVTRNAAPLSQNADLSDLFVEGLTLDPSFSSSVTDYAASVGYGVGSVTVTPTVAEAHATVTVNGNIVASGQASGQLHLSIGENEILILVTAQSGSTRTYAITVNRASAPLLAPVFNPAGGVVPYASELTIESAGADHIFYTTDGSEPSTSAGGSTLEYSDADKPKILGPVTFKAIAVKSGLQDSPVASAEYTVPVSANLSELALGADVQGFNFSPGVYEYKGVTVSADVQTIQVWPQGAGTIKVNGTTVVSGMPSEEIALDPGVEKQIEIEVAEAGKAPLLYTVHVTRADDTPPPSSGDTPPHLTNWSARTPDGAWLSWIYSVQWDDGIPLDTYAATVPEAADSVQLTLNFDESEYDYALIYPWGSEEIEFYSGQTQALPLQDGAISRYEMYFYKDGQSVENIRDVLKIRRGAGNFSSVMTSLDVSDQDWNSYSILPWSTDKEYVLYAGEDATSLSFDSYDYNNDLTVMDAEDHPFEDATYDIPIGPGETLLNVHISDEFSEDVFKLRVVKTPPSPSLKLSSLTLEGTDVWFNPITRSFEYVAATGASAVTLNVEALAGASVERVIVDGAAVPLDGGEFALSVPSEGETVAGIVVASGSERYVHRLSVRAMPSVIGLNSWTLRQGSSADGPVIHAGYDEAGGEGSGSVYAVVGENVSTVRLELQADRANIEVSGNFPIEDLGGGVWLLSPEQGMNGIHISVEPEDYNYSDIYVDLIRGEMPLEDLEISSAVGYEVIPYEKTGPQQYYAATQMDSIKLYPSMRDYDGHFEIWAHGEKLASNDDPISLANYWNEDIYIHTYDYHGGMINIYQVVVWRGAMEPADMGVEWNLLDEFANVATMLNTGRRAVIGPESSYAIITPVVTGGSVERVYADGTEIGQSEAQGSYDIPLGELYDGLSASTEVSLIVRTPDNKLIPRTLTLVHGLLADNAALTALAGQTTSVELQIHLPSGFSDAPTIEVVTPPVNGSYEIDGSTLSYTPNEGFTGKDSIQYRAIYTVEEEGGEGTQTYWSQSAEVGITVPGISLQGNSVDGATPAGAYVGQLTVLEPSAFTGAVSYELVEGAGDDHNALFTIGEEGRLKVGSAITVAHPELLSVRVRAHDSNGNSIEAALTIFHMDMSVLMYTLYNGGNDTGAVANRYAGGDYWVQYNTSADQVEHTSDFRIVVETSGADWNISSGGTAFQRMDDGFGAYKYTLPVEKPAPGSSVDYPIVIADASGHRHEFTFHYYLGPIPEELDGNGSDYGLQPAIEAAGEPYAVHKGVGDWDATVPADIEQLELSSVLAAGVRMTIYDDYGRVIGQENNTEGTVALTATFDLFAFGRQQNYYVHASNGSGTIMYPLRVYYEPVPELTSLRLWYTAGSGFNNVSISSEMSIEIPHDILIPEGTPYLPFGIEAVAETGQTVRVYRAEGEGDWVEIGLQNVTLHDGTQRMLNPFNYYEPYQSFKIEVSTLHGQTKNYYLALMIPGYGESS
ncbi:cadherin-like beta sandwich domain-containing protein [Cohnella sp. JJ-181]|uniref:cadherin-like beta sandwich domain-containing protein n=1 Tax=Cohnella rhizoplanae TaxID=2974897 RepID=UPI0022FF7B98|nr:cadherin-like beta sandwich domain-containing protein [Cohnella sp. JJ-181]CAI6081944.1 hypothetical protein COHCIP112018_03481 [Cohnella sp. JJ-181]